MAETVKVRNAGDVPVWLPTGGYLGAGASAELPRSAALRRLIEGGALATGDAPKKSGSGKSRSKDTGSSDEE